MPLSPDKAIAQAKEAYKLHVPERGSLDVIRRYWKGKQPLAAALPANSPPQVKRIAKNARINLCGLPVTTLAQSMYVDGFRTDAGEEREAWSVWQANRMDARQSGIHRAAIAYNAAYAVVLPGDPEPVIRGVSSRAMTALYGEDPDWPMWALERCGRGVWKLYDEEAVYYLERRSDTEWSFVESREHDAGVTPVVRFRDEDDLDADDEVDPDPALFGETNAVLLGQVAPLFSLQDQTDLTTIGLLVAQHYGAFRQRYIMGWVAEEEEEMMKASASSFWTFEDVVDEDGNEIKIGEFNQSDLSGYIESRDAVLRYAASLSQTPVHELTGSLINLSAEALAAAEAGKDRKVNERQTLNGEAHEQVFQLIGRYKRLEIPADAQVVWRETSARSFAATVDGLGKLVTMLGIPMQELWERVPGATQQDVARWKAAAQQGDSFAVLTDLLERQAANGATEPALA